MEIYNLLARVWGLPDMMSSTQGGRGQGKADVLRWLREFHSINQFQMRTRGVKKSENFVDVINGCSLCQTEQNFPM